MRGDTDPSYLSVKLRVLDQADTLYSSWLDAILSQIFLNDSHQHFVGLLLVMNKPGSSP